MAKKKRLTDIDLRSRQIVEETIEEPLTEKPAQEPTTTQPTREKNSAAVALGRLGGLKGGKARAEKLSSIWARKGTDLGDDRK